MRPRTSVYALLHGRIQVITKAINSLYVTNIKAPFPHIIYIGGTCRFLISAMIMGIQM
jgi:hypothetical protein